MEQQVLAPKYPIGQIIFMARTKSERRKHACPDCNDTKQWKAISPAGAEHTVKCPRCQGGYWGDGIGDKIPSLDFTHYEPEVVELKITGYCVNEYNSGKVKYSSATSTHSSYSFEEEKIITEQQVAENLAKLLAAEANEKEQATIEYLVGRHFAHLTIDDARLEVFRSEMWHAHYHLGNIISALRELLEQSEGWDEETLRKEITDKVRWDFGYHFEHMPLSPLFKAVERLIVAPEEEASAAVFALREAWDKLPEPVRVVVSEELLAVARKRVGY